METTGRPTLFHIEWPAQAFPDTPVMALLVTTLGATGTNGTGLSVFRLRGGRSVPMRQLSDRAWQPLPPRSGESRETLRNRFRNHCGVGRWWSAAGRSQRQGQGDRRSRAGYAESEE